MQVPGIRATERVVHVVQGEFSVGDGHNVILSTVLGSCVAACIRDPLANIGGMNHFLLPGGREYDSEGVVYGVQAMELLINALMRRGAAKNRLEAKLFGGARMVAGLSDIGTQNAKFAREFLAREAIPCIGESLGGERARRVRYWPASGRAQQILLSARDMPVIEAPSKKPLPAAQDSGDAELF